MDKKRHSKVEENSQEQELLASNKLINIRRDVLVKSKEHQQAGVKSRNGTHNFDLLKLRGIIEGNMEKKKDIDGIMELLPDLQLVMEILVSSILSPKDLMVPKLNIFIDDNAPGEIAELIRKQFTSIYDLETKMPGIIGDSLFKYGSVSLLPLSPTLIENFIRSNSISLENISTSDINTLRVPRIGILGGVVSENNMSYEFKLEGYSTKAADHFTTHVVPIAADKSVPKIKTQLKDLLKTTTSIKISDNPMILVKPELRKLMMHRKEKMLLSRQFGMEGFYSGNKNNGDMGVNPYLRKAYERAMVASIEKPTEKEVDKEKLNPIVFSFRHDVVLPVCQPGDPDTKIGYFIALDSEGYQIQPASTQNYFKELNDRLNQMAKSTEYQMVQNSHNGLIAGDNLIARNYTKPLLEIFIDEVEKKLAEAVKNGIHGDTVQIEGSDAFWQLMFARQLSNMETQMLYVPASLMTYFAYDVDDHGIGLSLLEKTKLYASLRAILLFANVSGSIKNAVGKRKLMITLDDDDPNKRETLETILNEFVSLQTSTLPLGKLTPADIVDGLQRAGVQVQVDGGEYFPGTSIDVESNERNLHVPDTDVEENLRRMHYAGLSVAPEQVDRSMEGEFAAGIVAGNLLFGKRTMVWQDQTCAMASDFIRKYIAMGGPLTTEIKKILAAEKDSISFEDLLESITMTLPRPDGAALAAQKEQFDDYIEFIDSALEYYVDTGILGDMLKGDNIKENVDAVKATIKAQLVRQFIRRENMLPELDDVIIGEDSLLLENVEGHNKAVIDIISSIVAATHKAEDKGESDLEVANRIIEKVREERTQHLDEIYGQSEEDEYGSSDTEEEEEEKTAPEEEEEEGGEEELPEEE